MPKTQDNNNNGTMNYKPVAKNIYHDGTSYRVRVSVKGERKSANFSNKKKAITFRRELLAAQRAA